MVRRGAILPSLRVGTGLAYWRRVHDPPLTAREVAELLHVAPSSYRLIEQGRMFPTRRTVELLVQILGVPPGSLFVPEVLDAVVEHS